MILLAPVSKQAMITEVQRLVRIAKDNFLIARDLVPENMTGHFMRRSGAKLMAGRMAGELATRDMMNNALTKVNSVEEAVKIAEKKFQDSLDSMEILDSSVNRVDFNKEVRKALIPSYLINLSGCKFMW